MVESKIFFVLCMLFLVILIIILMELMIKLRKVIFCCGMRIDFFGWMISLRLFKNFSRVNNMNYIFLICVVLEVKIINIFIDNVV